MRYCPSCGTKLTENTPLCPQCGHPLTIGQHTQQESKKRLAEAVAKQLNPAYCARCGSPLQVRKLQQNGFDEGTGYPKYDVILACPYATVYETSVLEKPWFTWKKPFDRHSVHKISKTIESNSDVADAR